MRPKLNILVLLTIGLVLFTSCRTGKKALQQGNYPDAVFQAVQRLRDNPDNKKSAETLDQAYPLAVSTLEQEIGQLLKSVEPFRYAEITHRYETLDRMGDEIRHCPAALKIIRKPGSYAEQLTAARQKAAPESYDAAMKLMDEGTRASAREAYYLFLDADGFVPGYRDVRDRIEEARFEATLKVVVEQIPVPGRYRISSEFFYDRVMAMLNEGKKMEFVAFYNPDEAKELPHVDEILMMEFDDFSVGTSHDKDTEKEYTSRDSVKTGTATINGKKVDVYDRVKARLTIHRREVVSSGILLVRIVDARSNKPLTTRRLPGSYTWMTEWANYNGDSRALTQEQLELCRKKQLLPPPPQELFLEFTKPVYDQLKGYLRNYYANHN
jgi:hypothetical protein